MTTNLEITLVFPTCMTAKSYKWLAKKSVLKKQTLITERFTIHKGNYASFYIKNFMDDLSLIEKAFGIFSKDPRIDSNGCCVESYLPEGSTSRQRKI